MIKILISGILFLIFSGCVANKISIEPIKALPFYDKDKANVYLVNNETEMGYQMEYKYIIESDRLKKDMLVCYSQYSYQSLDEGKYKFLLKNNGTNMVGEREDAVPYVIEVKKGEIYILKPDTTFDVKAALKFFTFVPLLNKGMNPVDPHIELKEIDKNLALEEINKGLQFTNIFNGGKRPYPKRAEDNIGNSCLDMAFDRF
ncbi:hypothetical protein [Halarcobacter anaerophilus]|uniref:DUF2846 domain-containing protein n=1 Tax=Halarcobacter anaerophilus TaxID=877500 RepID=A0A4Q0Y0Q4_9BACT|nr:hypothetical protein [Halarcobacter anaerophilus]QDF28972.1 hypothetical protein AANAER_1492 [Halarcobacter anaerophilus]RXJ63607.1 hypothetical protein CRV06_05285 [Halarcobacter anaerophilus]